MSMTCDMFNVFFSFLKKIWTIVCLVILIHFELSDLRDRLCSPNSPPQRQSLIGLSNKRLNCGENRPQAAITCDQAPVPAEQELNFRGSVVFFSQYFVVGSFVAELKIPETMF